MIETLPLGQIMVDPRLQPRAKGNDAATVAEYAEAYRRGEKLPEGVVVHTSKGWYFLAEGFQRFEGAKQAGLETLPFEVVKGEYIDAKLIAAGSNKGHGLKRTNEDKRRAVQFALEARTEWTNEEVANHVGVGQEMVADIRVALGAVVDDGDAEDTVTEDAEQPAEAEEKPEPRKRGRPNRTALAKKAGKEIRKNPEASDDEVAKTVNCKPELVTEVRRQLVEKGVIEKKLKGTTKSQQLNDELGVKVPDELRDLFGDPYLYKSAEALGEMSRKLAAMKRSVASKGIAWRYLQIEAIMNRLSAANREIELAMSSFISGQPYAVCPTCKGDGVKKEVKGDSVCSGHGYVPKWRYDECLEAGTIKKK